MHYLSLLNYLKNLQLQICLQKKIKIATPRKSGVLVKFKN